MKLRSKGQRGVVMDGFTEVTVQVPVGRLADFHVMYGNWLRGEESGGEAAPGTATLSVLDTGANHQLAAWATEDLEDAKTVWSKMTNNARTICSVLMQEPDRTFTGTALAELAGVQGGFGFLGGFLAWPAKYCYATGHEHLVSYDTQRELFWMKPATAEVFAKAREA
jgi:hypothetical protein